jgi:predicted 2-oxoglutarate/Fe(II)-dependent dioxygenase YbiX
MSRTLTAFPMHIQREMMSSRQCEELIDTVEQIDAWTDFKVAPDQVGNGVHQGLYDLRDACFLELHESVMMFLTDVNEETWRFVLDGWQQPLRIAKYTPGYRHDWHTDYTGDDASKLAFSMPLNADYSGGELQILEAERITQRPGQAVVFPAFQGHRVTEVTAGVRYVLLGWLTGPRFV